MKFTFKMVEKIPQVYGDLYVYDVDSNHDDIDTGRYAIFKTPTGLELLKYNGECYATLFVRQNSVLQALEEGLMYWCAEGMEQFWKPLSEQGD